MRGTGSPRIYWNNAAGRDETDRGILSAVRMVLGGSAPILLSPLLDTVVLGKPPSPIGTAIRFGLDHPPWVFDDRNDPLVDALYGYRFDKELVNSGVAGSDDSVNSGMA